MPSGGSVVRARNSEKRRRDARAVAMVAEGRWNSGVEKWRDGLEMCRNGVDRS